MNTQFDDFIDVLKVLVRAPSVTGSEHSFYRVLQRELEERGAKVSWYEGLLVAQGNKPNSAMFSAHIDRHGLICTGPNEFQYAAFVAGSRSDLLGNSVSEQLINKIVDRFNDADVIAYEPWSGAYLGRGQIHKSYICEYRNNLIFEIDGLNHLLAGTPVAFTDKLEINQGYLSSQLDNVLTAAALVHLFSLGFEGTAFFTAQEEAGKSWRYLLEWFRRFGQSANNLIVVDTSPYPDTQAADQQKIVLRHRDANAFFDVKMSEKIENICQNQHISYAYKDDFISAKNREIEKTGGELLSYGSTEMGRIIQASNGVVTGTTIQVPTTGYHTMEETASVESIKAFLSVLMALSN
ncbi:peptidase M42 [Catenovulum sp. 2E275]|uniref:peptidase M42 n=1 Tax=Catenovulum sp. 2E275 TaxID=2980497 RepID=UPI0021D07743|nr:peptidase M42 [Catenovulum sp. 2E275]MCU4676927.1 peptidase M42 [Catenovulum sp. 2E275]